MAFSCGARSAFEQKGRSYLRNMLSRRQLQGFVMPRRIRLLSPTILRRNFIEEKINIMIDTANPTRTDMIAVPLELKRDRHIETPFKMCQRH